MNPEIERIADLCRTYCGGQLDAGQFAELTVRVDKFISENLVRLCREVLEGDLNRVFASSMLAELQHAIRPYFDGQVSDWVKRAALKAIAEGTRQVL